MNRYITEPCPYCNGSGSVLEKMFRTLVGCYHCNSTGLAPNDEGLEIIKLVRDYGHKYHSFKFRKKETASSDQQD